MFSEDILEKIHNLEVPSSSLLNTVLVSGFEFLKLRLDPQKQNYKFAVV